MVGEVKTKICTRVLSVVGLCSPTRRQSFQRSLIYQASYLRMKSIAASYLLRELSQSMTGGRLMRYRLRVSSITPENRKAILRNDQALYILAVAPEHQRKGAGKLLMKSGLGWVDRIGAKVRPQVDYARLSCT